MFGMFSLKILFFDIIFYDLHKLKYKYDVNKKKTFKKKKHVCILRKYNNFLNIYLI
jgi:hypothetical protein